MSALRRLVHLLWCDWEPWSADFEGVQRYVEPGGKEVSVYPVWLQQRSCRICNKRQLREAA